MNVRDLIPWSRQEGRLPALYREGESNPLLGLHRDMNRLFDDVLRGFAAPTLGAVGGRNLMVWPQIEVNETDREIRVVAELPSMTEKDVELMVEDGILTLRGEKKSETEDKDRGYSERYYGRFERRIGLPGSAREDKIEAHFDNGVLTVTLPKSPEAERGRRIPINATTRH